MNTLKVIVLLIELSTVFSLECWDCKSSINAACSDPFLMEPFAKMNCSASPKYEMIRNMYGNKTTQFCRKIIEKIEGNVRVIRTCGYLEESRSDEDRCNTRIGTNGLQIVSCHCATDACNASPYLTHSMVTTSFTIMFTLILTAAFS